MWKLAPFIIIVLTLLCAAMIKVALQPFGKEHTDDEAAEPYDLYLDCEDREKHDCWSWTKTANTPAEPKAESS